ncbi:MAG: hypothetical protein AUJ11_00495 [Parcubacteria group bacterium CG1_02_44_65]|nr:hypothetical protein [Candidatus Falkowbacteria bacterium]OIO52575.1 MAG: hypothetical protein AUJ11_00495 [Parcubacteria group bacterium CG1_02_44_65]OIP78950.1 MAG: hypothetical protein AUK20_02795 [Parcubacteria group bacterium CG2_30_45_37]
MSKRNKIIVFIVILLILLVLIFVISPKALANWRWRQTAQAVGGLPYQIGLTKVAIIQCITTGNPPICAGGPLCATLDVARCTAYSEVNGTPSGGMGANALFLNTAIAQAGLTPGGQLIAGGLSPVLMDQGVLASAGGCYGCVAKQGLADKIFAWLDKFIIAGFKGK